MKHKVTRKGITNSFGLVLSVPYCDLQHLLMYEDAFGYNAGIYGWNCDYYAFDDICICTGYRPHGKTLDYNFIKRYNDAAHEIIKKYDCDYNNKINNLEKLLEEFIREIKQMYNV